MPGHRKLSSSEYLGIWRRGAKWAFACCLLGAGVGYLLTWVLPAKYTGTVTLQSTVRDGDASKPGPQITPDRIAEFRQRVLTPQALRELAGHYEVHSGGKQAPMDVQIAELDRNIVLEPQGTAFRVSFTAADENVARDVCAEISRLFAAAKLPQSEPAAGNSPGGSSRQFLAKQVEEARLHREQQDARLAEFKRKHAGEIGVVDADRGDAQVILAAYNRQLLATDAALKSAQEKRAALTEALFARQPGTTAPSTARQKETPQTQALEQELAAKQAELVTLQARYTADHPDVVKMKADIRDLQRRIDDAKRAEVASAANKSASGADAPAQDTAQIQVQIRSLDSQIEEKTRDRDRLQQEIQTAQAQLENAPVVQMEYAEFKRAADAAKDAYDGWVAKQQEFQKTLNGQDPANQSALVAIGQPSVALTFPVRWQFVLAGAACGLALGLLLPLVGNWGDKTLRTKEDIQYFLALPTLAIIPLAAAGEGTSGIGGPRGGRMGKRGKKEASVLADA